MTDLAKKAKAQQWTTVPDNTTIISKVVKNPKKIMLLANEDDDTPFSVFVVPYDPVTGRAVLPISVQGSAGIVIASNVIPQGVGGSQNITLGSPGLDVNAVINLFDANAVKYQVLEQPSLIISARATGAASTQLLAAGGAGAKYKIFAMSIDVSGTAATGQVSINEATSGLVLLASDIGAAGTAGNALSIYGGVLQPTANNALQVTSVASATVNATLVYGPAR